MELENIVSGPMPKRRSGQYFTGESTSMYSGRDFTALYCQDNGGCGCGNDRKRRGGCGGGQGGCGGGQGGRGGCGGGQGGCGGDQGGCGGDRKRDGSGGGKGNTPDPEKKKD